MAYITNRTAKQHYVILNTVRAGIVLLGTEVKSIRTGKGSLLGAKVLIRDGEVFLVGATIPPHQEKNAPPAYDPDRTRRLLLHKGEIQKLVTQTEAKNLTLIPISVYNCNRLLKIDIGVARKKNARDKRDIVRKRESERALKRQLH